MNPIFAKDTDRLNKLMNCISGKIGVVALCVVVTIGIACSLGPKTIHANDLWRLIVAVVGGGGGGVV